jgi:hypothetical protein
MKIRSVLGAMLIVVLGFASSAMAERTMTNSSLETTNDPSCAAIHQACGKKAKRKKPKECCEGLVCNQNYCSPYQDIEEPCSPTSPPCLPGLKCMDGHCQ